MATDSEDKISKGIEDFLTYLREMEQLHSISLMNESEANDTIQQTYPITEWMENNRSVIKGLEQLLGRVRKEEKNTEGRFYTPRTEINNEQSKKNRKVISK